METGIETGNLQHAGPEDLIDGLNCFQLEAIVRGRKFILRAMAERTSAVSGMLSRYCGPPCTMR